MSLQGLISGSECAVQSNPLTQVLKHTEGDRSLQQDRIAGPSTARLHQLPVNSVANEHDLALARQFFDGSAPTGPAFTLPRHLPPAELLRMEEPNRSGPALNDVWAIGQHHRRVLEESGGKDAWANEFDYTPQLSSPDYSMQNAVLNQSDVQHRPSYMSPGNMWGSTRPMGTFGANMGSALYQGNYGLSLDQVRNKGKTRDADFEAAFAQMADSLSSARAGSPGIIEANSDMAGVVDALRDVTLETQKEGEVTNQDADFQTVWEDLQKSDVPPQENLAKWEAELNQMMNSNREELDDDLGAHMQNAWEGGIGDFREDGPAEQVTFDDEGLPILGEYIFDTNNKYLDPSTTTRSALSEAKALLEQNGSLSEAALLLEVAIQRGELGEGGYETWILLGETKTMDEHEDAGVRALIEGVNRAEAAGVPGPGMLSLAISYTNESFEKACHTMLLRWLRARFPSHHVPEETIKAMRTNSSWDTHARVTDVFLSLARQQHAGGHIDPDVQIGLGILFYSNGEYDRAKDCFETALSLRPKDYLLWNRLGSSLSNGSKPEEALGAYRQALQLRPTYTRAIYNVGVACLNIGAHKEAAEHFLSALAMQESIGSGSSQQLWFTLRRAFMLMDRPELADLAKPEVRANLEVFRKEGFDF